MQNYAVVQDGWVVSQGFNHLVPYGAILLDEALSGLDYVVDWDGSLQPLPRPSRYHRRQPGGTWALDAEAFEAAVRRDRAARLAASDWVALRAGETGAPVPPAWAEYRQALRDITEQPGFPESVLWPSAPL